MRPSPVRISRLCAHRRPSRHGGEASRDGLPSDGGTRPRGRGTGGWAGRGSPAAGHGGLARPGDDPGPAPARRDAGPGARPRPRASARAPRGAAAGGSPAAEGQAGSKVAGAPSAVGQWSPRYAHRRDRHPRHAAAHREGALLQLRHHREHQHRRRSGTRPPTPASASTPRRTRTSGAPARPCWPTAACSSSGGNIPKGTSTQFRGLDSIWIFDPWTETWTFQGQDERRALVPHHDPAARRPGRHHQRSAARRLGAAQHRRRVFTPSPDRAKAGTITTVGQQQLQPLPAPVRHPRRAGAGRRALPRRRTAC